MRDVIDAVPTRPYDDGTPLPDINPLGKVPTLILENGEYLGGGPVLYEYLDSLHDRTPLYPRAGEHRWMALRRAWLADGLFDTLVLLIVESWRDRDDQRLEYADRLVPRIGRILSQMQKDAAEFGERDIAWFRCVGALAFLDRVADSLTQSLVASDHRGLAWRDNAADLASWYDAAKEAEEFNRPLQVG